MASEICHTMSLQQLDELWKYDFHLCATLTDLPLRSCSASPNDSLNDLFPPMRDEEFRKLRQDILKMWVRASYFFKFKNVAGKGWGVFCPSDEDEGYPSNRLLSPTKPTILGWLAKAPQENQCPTAHRYLRSPVGDNLYLGGPISLVNQDPVGRLSVLFPTCKGSAARHVVTVLSARKLIAGSELFWTYVEKGVSSKNLDMHPISAWFLPECCREVVDRQMTVVEHPQPSAASSATSTPPAKRRCVGGLRPLTKSRELPRFCLCTYCGMNVDEDSSYSPNLKRHLSLYHAVDIVRELGKDPLDQDNPATSKEFTLHLNKVDNVLDSLHKRFFNCQPACSFLKTFEKELQLRSGLPIQDEKERVFQLFLSESLLAYKKYQVVYLRGVSVPTKYDDLLPCSTFTNHDKVVWCDSNPSKENFSINKFKLSNEEKEDHKLEIMCALKDIIANYSED